MLLQSSFPLIKKLQEPNNEYITEVNRQRILQLDKDISYATSFRQGKETILMICFKDGTNKKIRSLQNKTKRVEKNTIQKKTELKELSIFVKKIYYHSLSQNHLNLLLLFSLLMLTMCFQIFSNHIYIFLLPCHTMYNSMS